MYLKLCWERVLLAENVAPETGREAGQDQGGSLKGLGRAKTILSMGP